MAKTSEKKAVAQLLHSYQPHSYAVFFFTQPTKHMTVYTWVAQIL